MGVTDGRSAGSADTEDTEHAPVIAHRSSPDRVVFVAKNNPDAWIATDVTVDLIE